MVPDSGLTSAFMASASSFWPLPSMPARPTISPARISKLKPFTCSIPRSSLTWRSLIERTTSPGVAGFFSTCRLTFLPTISVASSVSDVLETSTVLMYLPRRIMVHSSAEDIISLSLWVITMMVLPLLTRSCMIWISFSISCGVRTAVGSSRIRISAPRYRAFKISTRCCIPTEISSILASGSTSKPYSSTISRTFSRARFGSRTPPALVTSLPKTIFSVTVKFSTNIKCW